MNISRFNFNCKLSSWIIPFRSYKQQGETRKNDTKDRQKERSSNHHQDIGDNVDGGAVATDNHRLAAYDAHGRGANTRMSSANEINTQSRIQSVDAGGNNYFFVG